MPAIPEQRPPYDKMYRILCRASSLALERLPDTAANAEARDILQQALYKAEDLYIETDE